MNEFNFQKAISKYGILLSINYLFSFVWIYFLSRYASSIITGNYMEMYSYMSILPSAVNYIFNSVLAVLVYKDFKRNGLKNPLIVLITLFFGFIGIVLFFVQLIYTLYIRQGRKLS